MAHISVWINRTDRRDRYFGGYQQGDPLELALRLEAEGHPDDLVEMVFVRLNEPTPRVLGTMTVEQIEHYHTKFPSLSVGDVVEIDGRFHQIAPVGHGPIDNPMWADNCEGCDERRIVWPSYGCYLLCADCLQGDYRDSEEDEATVNEILDYEADNPVGFEPNEIDAALQDPNRRRNGNSRN
jgi:hypothetical protein